MLKINGVAVATPKSLSVEVMDLDAESGRNANGSLIRDRIAVKRKINAEWPAMSMSEMSTLLQAVTGVFFEVEYPDPLEGAMLTKTFYVGDRSTPVAIVRNGQVLWEGVSMNFIER